MKQLPDWRISIIVGVLLLAFTLAVSVIPAFAQRPVRGSLFKKTPSPEQKPLAPPEEVDERFADTLTIAVGDGGAKPETLTEDYEKAIALYQGKQYGEACAIFLRLRQSLPKQHQLLPDVIFMNAECAAVQGQLTESQKLLAGLIEDAATPRPVLEKAIVRLGHVLCGLGNTAKAAEFFARLKRDFPNSAYLRVASCGAIE